MSSYESDRRRLLRVLLSLPVGYIASCSNVPNEDAGDELSAVESLRLLIRLLGPWPDPAGPVGDRIAERFLAAPHLKGKFLPGSSRVVQRVAGRFVGAARPFAEVDLVPLEPGERALLLELATELYSLNEIQCLAANQPPFGECQTDGTWHTQAPTEP